MGCVGGETVLYTCHSVPRCTELAYAISCTTQASEQMPSQQTYKIWALPPKTLHTQQAVDTAVDTVHQHDTA